MNNPESLIAQCEEALKQARSQIRVMAIYCSNDATDPTLAIINDAIKATKRAKK